MEQQRLSSDNDNIERCRPMSSHNTISSHIDYGPSPIYWCQSISSSVNYWKHPSYQQKFPGKIASGASPRSFKLEIFSSPYL